MKRSVKKLTACVLAAIMAVGSVPLGMLEGSLGEVFAAEASNEYVVATVSETAADESQFEFKNGVIIKYNGDATDVVIPESIGGVPVTTIGITAFSSCSILRSVTIPNSVTAIGKSAFEYCLNLRSVTIPNSVTVIGDSAFYSCSSLKEITIPESVTVIGNSAFEGCSSLKEIIIPKSVTLIGSRMFYECSNLKSVTIPEGVTSIGNSAFYCCRSLTSVTIPESVIEIDAHAFEECSGLTNVTILEGVTTIGFSAFANCRSLISVIIPESVTTISSDAFYYCSNLRNVTILEGVTTICSYAFCGCSSLRSVNIPESVTLIQDKAFEACSSLKAINVAEDNSYYFSSDGTLYEINEYGRVTLKQYPLGKLSEGEDVPDTAASYLKLSVEYDDYGFYIADYQFNTKQLISSDDEYENIIITDKIVDSSLSAEDINITAYDIKFVDNQNNSVHPNSTMNVILRCPTDYVGENCKVYQVADNGNLTDMNAVYTNDCLSFETDQLGLYIITETELKTIIYGDANNDREVDISDAVVLKKYLAGIKDSEINLTACDVNVSGEVDVSDAVILLKYLAGIKDIELGVAS